MSKIFFVVLALSLAVPLFSAEAQTKGKRARKGRAPAAAPAAEPEPAPPAEPAPALEEPAPAPVAAEPAAAQSAEPAVSQSAEVSAAKPEGSGLVGIALAPKVGAVIPTSKLGATFALGLEAGYTFPFLRDKLPSWMALFEPALMVEFSYLEPKKVGSGSSDLVGGAFAYDLAQRIMILAFDAIVKFTPWIVQPYGGIGYGFYFLHAEQKSYGLTNQEDQLYSGLQLRAGAEYAIWHGGVMAELRYHYTGLGFLSTGQSNAGGITISAGYRFVF